MTRDEARARAIDEATDAGLDEDQVDAVRDMVMSTWDEDPETLDDVINSVIQGVANP